jgi:hypothetical protein
MSSLPDVRWILVFDGGCDLCTRVASRAQKMADGELDVLPQTDPWVTQVIGHVPLAGPVLIENGPRPRVHSGIGMRARIVRIVGVRNALALRRIVEHGTEPGRRVDEARRSFILRGATAAAGLAGFALLGPTEEADAACTAKRCHYWKRACGTSLDGCGCDTPCLDLYRCVSASGQLCYVAYKCAGCGCRCT